MSHIHIKRLVSPLSYIVWISSSCLAESDFFFVKQFHIWCFWKASLASIHQIYQFVLPFLVLRSSCDAESRTKSLPSCVSLRNLIKTASSTESGMKISIFTLPSFDWSRSFRHYIMTCNLYLQNAIVKASNFYFYFLILTNGHLFIFVQCI